MATGWSWVKGPRFVLEADDEPEDCACFVLGLDDKSRKRLFISVAEEQAMDSYNANVECKLSATIAQAIQLRDWLNSLDLKE